MFTTRPSYDADINEVEGFNYHVASHEAEEQLTPRRPVNIQRRGSAYHPYRPATSNPHWDAQSFSPVSETATGSTYGSTQYPGPYHDAGDLYLVYMYVACM